MIDRHLYTSAVCEAEGFIYIVDTRGEKPCIFRIDPDGKSSELLARIEKADSKAPKMAFIGVTYFEGSIFLVPKFLHGINFIIIFEIRTCRVRYKEIVDSNFAPYCGYESLNRIGDEWWFFPHDIQDDVVVLSLQNEELYTVSEWARSVRQLQKTLKPLGRSLKSGDSILVDDHIYTPLTDTQYIASFDIRSRDTQIYSLENDARLTFPIVYTGKDFWMSKRRNEGLVSWNPKEGVLSEIDMGRYKNSRLGNYHGWYHKILYFDKCLWILPKNDNVLLKISTESYEMRTIKISDFEEREDLENRQYWVTEEEGILRIYPCNRSWSVEVSISGDGKLGMHNEMYQPKEWTQQSGSLLHRGTWDNKKMMEDSLQDLITYMKVTNN